MTVTDVSTVNLQDLCDLVTVQIDPGAVPDAAYLGLEHLGSGRLRPMSFGLAADTTSHKSLFECGDVLYGKLRPYLDKAVLINVDGVCTTELLVLRAKPHVVPQYLACVVHAPKFVEHAVRGITGAHHPRTSWAHVSEFEVAERERDEQEAIANVLWGIQDLCVSCEEVIKSAGELKRAAMQQLFMHGLRGEEQKETDIGPIPKSWEVVQLGSLGRIGNGSTPKRAKAEYWTGGTFPWLNSAKVYDREVETADQFVTATALAECHLPLLEPGAVLVAITGQGKTLGHVAVLRTQATINQHLAYLQPDLRRVAPGFVRGYLETQYEALRQVASGGGSTKGALTCAYLRGLSVPLPPTTDEQREIVEVLDALDRKIELHRRKRAVLEQLFKSLLHKLMTGEVSVDDLDLSALQPAGGTAA